MPGGSWRLRRASPLPAPSRNWGSAPDPGGMAQGATEAFRPAPPRRRAHREQPAGADVHALTARPERRPPRARSGPRTLRPPAHRPAAARPPPLAPGPPADRRTTTPPLAPGPPADRRVPGGAVGAPAGELSAATAFSSAPGVRGQSPCHAAEPQIGAAGRGGEGEAPICRSAACARRTPRRSAEGAHTTAAAGRALAHPAAVTQEPSGKSRQEPQRTNVRPVSPRRPASPGSAHAPGPRPPGRVWPS